MVYFLMIILGKSCAFIQFVDLMNWTGHAWCIPVYKSASKRTLAVLDIVY